ncbi:MAG: hypothetical protein QM802_03500 [Agriterribacter sp.]
MQIINSTCGMKDNAVSLFNSKPANMIKLKYLIALAIAFILLGTTGCKKKDNAEPPGNYYMKFNANGVSKNFKGGLSNFSQKNSDTDYGTALLASGSDTDPNIDIFAIGLTTEGANKTNITYTNYKTTASGFEKAKLLFLSYTDDQGTKYTAIFDDETIGSVYAEGIANNQLIVTEATAAYTKGKFSGTLYADDYTKEMKITEGEFYLEQD